MKQPRALNYLFATEMWERFGFYIIQGILIIYMTDQLRFSDIRSYGILGDFTALAYISPILGGFLADRVLGFRQAVLIGAGFLFLGYALITTTLTNLLLWGLACLVAGNGFLKPNISSFLGTFYGKDDARREGGFTIFYMGINLGVILSSLSAGFVREQLGWMTTFSMAAVGMVLAIICFTLGFKSYANKGLAPLRDKIRPTWMVLFSNKLILASIIAALIAVSFLLLNYHGVAKELFIALGISLALILVLAASRYEHIQRRRFYALIILIFISIVFWILYIQIYLSINLFIERCVDRHLFGITIPPIAFLALESIFILLTGPVFAWTWRKLHERGSDPNYSIKFALSLFATSAAMGILVVAIHWHPLTTLLNPIWIIVFFFVLTIGEMLLSPIGLSMVTELAPQKLTGLMMGVWFMVIGFGAFIAGMLADTANVPRNVTSLTQINLIYRAAFIDYALIALGCAILLLILAPWIKRLTQQN